MTVDKKAFTTWAHEFKDEIILDPALESFKATLDAHGVYETKRFVLRLSPKNHDLLNSLEKDGNFEENVSPEVFQAYSTYLHETIHWWQHVGSTSGLMSSLSYFAQSHSSIAELRRVLASFGPKKSLFLWTNKILAQEGDKAQERLKDANVAVNNALDIEYYKMFAFNPQRNAQRIFEQTHFESIGHGYSIAYGQLLGMISNTIDNNFSIIPNGLEWDENFARLNKDKKEGFYHGSPIRSTRIGLQAIYEGQARFIQLQFLNSIVSEPFTCEDYRGMGYFEGIYGEAFNYFLELSNSPWPEKFDDPIIGLFLLVCDLSINPTRGVPIDIEDFENFITDVDVGRRFVNLSLAVKNMPHLKTSVKVYSREEYLSISEQLVSYCKYDQPLEALDIIRTWKDSLPDFQSLMEEHKTFRFKQENMPIRIFLSHFFSFCDDKLQSPEFFCWPGIRIIGQQASEKYQSLWLKHLSLFGDRVDKPGIYPRSRAGIEELTIKQTFTDFYAYIVLYDLTLQWILQGGPFKCEYQWLYENYSQEKANENANSIFKQAYGVNLSDFEIVSK